MGFLKAMMWVDYSVFPKVALTELQKVDQWAEPKELPWAGSSARYWAAQRDCSMVVLMADRWVERSALTRDLKDSTLVSRSANPWVD